MKDRLGNHIQQVRGVSYKPSDLSENLSDGYTVLLRANNISEGRINFDSVQFVRNNKISQEQILKTNDILVCSSSGSISLVGKSALYKKSGEHTFGAFCKVVRATGKLHPQFIAFYMCSQAYRKHIEHIANGANINNLRNEHLDEIQLDIPTDDQQKVIVSKLEKIQSIITHRRTQLFKLDELIKCRFVELFGDQKMNPYGWPQTTVGNCCILKSGTSLPADKENEGGTIPYVKVSDMNYPGNEHYITTSSRFVTEQTAGVGVFPVGTVIFPKRGGAIGTNKKRLTKLPICADLNVMGVIAGSNLASQYLMAYFDMIDLGALDNGSSVPQINNKDIAPLPICTPPIELQEQFAAFVEKADKFKFACFFFQLITVLQKIIIFFRNFLICFLF